MEFIWWSEFSSIKILHFGIQPGPVLKTATLGPLAGDRRRDSANLVQCFTNWVKKAVGKSKVKRISFIKYITLILISNWIQLEQWTITTFSKKLQSIKPWITAFGTPFRKQESEMYLQKLWQRKTPQRNFKKLLFNYYRCTLRRKYDTDDSSTGKTICRICNMTRNLTKLLICCF